MKLITDVKKPTGRQLEAFRKIRDSYHLIIRELETLGIDATQIEIQEGYALSKITPG